MGDGSHIHKINDSRANFLEKQRRRSIELGNQLLDERIKEIMTRKTYSTTHRGLRMFSRPEARDENSRLKEIESAKNNFKITLS